MHLHDMQRRMMLPAVEGVGRRMMMMAKAAESFVVNDDGGDVYLYSLLPLQQLHLVLVEHPFPVIDVALFLGGWRRRHNFVGSVATIISEFTSFLTY